MVGSATARSGPGAIWVKVVVKAAAKRGKSQAEEQRADRACLTLGKAHLEGWGGPEEAHQVVLQEIRKGNITQSL